MDPLQTLALNAKAVALMQEGHFSQAVAVLRTALDEIIQSLGLLASSERSRACADGSKVAHTLPIFISSIPLAVSPSLDKGAAVYQDHHSFSIFDRALTITGTDPSALASMVGQNSLAVVVLYNMGLIHQLRGLRHLKGQKNCFIKAMQIYKMALSVLGRCSESIGGEDLASFLYLAVLNNMGHIHSHFCETQQAHQCLDRIRCILVSIPGQILDERSDFCLFRMNVVTLHCKQLVAAAAA